jgi:hypothetical protein
LLDLAAGVVVFLRCGDGLAATVANVGFGETPRFFMADLEGSVGGEESEPPSSDPLIERVRRRGALILALAIADSPTSPFCTCRSSYAGL